MKELISLINVHVDLVSFYTTASLLFVVLLPVNSESSIGLSFWNRVAKVFLLMGCG